VHERKAGAVDQAESAPVRGEKSRHRDLVPALVDPCDIDKGQDIIAEGAQRGEPQAAPHQRAGFQGSTVGSRGISE